MKDQKKPSLEFEDKNRFDAEWRPKKGLASKVFNFVKPKIILI